MQRIRATVSSVRTLTPTSIEIELHRSDGLPFPQFLPGQYATISFPAYRSLRGERAFSIASPPTRLNSICFGIRTHGKYTSGLRGLRRGDAAMVGGPFGTFTFDPEKDHNAVLVAGGIGVTPFVSMVQYAADRRLSNSLTLLYSVRSLDDAAYREELDAAAKRSSNIRVVYAVTNEKVRSEKERIMPGYITCELLWWAMGEKVDGQSLFLCGPKPFMDAMHKEFGWLGVPRSRIRTERFSAGSAELIERATPIPKIALAVWGTAALIFVGTIARIERAKRAAAIVSIPATTSVPATNQATDVPISQNINAVPSPQTNLNVTPTQQQYQRPSVLIHRTVVVPRTRMS